MSKVALTTKIKHFSESAMLRGVRTVPRICMLYPGFRFATEEKSMGKIQQQGSQNFQLGTIHYVNFATF